MFHPFIQVHAFVKLFKGLDPSLLSAGHVGDFRRLMDERVNDRHQNVIKCGKKMMSSPPQRSEPRVSPQGRGAGLPPLLSGLPGVALPHRGHHRQPAAEHRALIRTRVHQTPRLLPGKSTISPSVSQCVSVCPIITVYHPPGGSPGSPVRRALGCTWSAPGT